MIVRRDKRTPLSDADVWKAISEGDMFGVEFGHEDYSIVPEVFMSTCKLIKPKNIQDLTVALTLSYSQWWDIDSEISKTIKEAYIHGINNGPFSELKETCGYPLFIEQVEHLLINNLKVDEKEAEELLEGLIRKRRSAMMDLYSFSWMENEQNLYLWKYASTLTEEKILLHQAALIYEAFWIVYNSSKDNYYIRSPMIID